MSCPHRIDELCFQYPDTTDTAFYKPQPALEKSIEVTGSAHLFEQIFDGCHKFCVFFLLFEVVMRKMKISTATGELSTRIPKC
jgi:hypothetical protein